MMMYAEWVVEGYVGYTKHEIVLCGSDFFTMDSAIKAAKRLMLHYEGLDEEEDLGLVKILDIYPRSRVE